MVAFLYFWHMKKGFIFWRNKQYKSKESYHPIIYWEKTGRDEFIGLMITHATASQYGNLDLSDDSYFDEKKADFSKTFIVNALLLKPVDWLVGYTKIGQLSSKGIKYVETITDGIKPITWDIYNALK